MKKTYNKAHKNRPQAGWTRRYAAHLLARRYDHKRNKMKIFIISLLFGVFITEHAIAQSISSEMALAQDRGKILFEAFSDSKAVNVENFKNYKELKKYLKGNKCDGLKYSYYVIKDKFGQEILYVLGSSEDSVAVVGGRHFRFDISNNKVNLGSVFSSTKTCFVMPTPENAVGIIMTHLTSKTPTEFHVYLNFKHEQTVYIGIGENMWRVESGKVDNLGPIKS